MKFCMKKPDLEELLKEKRFELNNGHLNGAQESKLIKDIDALEKSLPLANKLFPLEEK